jgi:nucleotide-binding universal stress UspA family protein
MKKILVPCDFTDTSENALNYAVEAAVFFSADLVLVHVSHYPVVTPEIGLSSYSYQDAEKDSMDALGKIRNRIISGRNFNGRIDCFAEMGDVSESVEKFAREQGAELIVMGISGHGSKFMKNLIGSAAVDVSQEVDVPVLIIPPGYTYKKPGIVIYACQYEEQISIEPGFIKVQDLCSALGATLQLLHVIEEKNTAKFPLHDNYAEHPGAAGDLKTYIIHEKHAAEAILNFLNDHTADIIAIHPKKHRFIERLFRSNVTNEIAFNSKVPVLTVH